MYIHNSNRKHATTDVVFSHYMFTNYRKSKLTIELF